MGFTKIGMVFTYCKAKGQSIPTRKSAIKEANAKGGKFGVLKVDSFVNFYVELIPFSTQENRLIQCVQIFNYQVR